MKKIIIIIVALAGLVGMLYFAKNLSENAGKSDNELIEFAIKDVESIDKIIITDKFENVFELRKTKGIWTDKKGGCVTQDKVSFCLDAFKNIEFKGYLADNSKKKFTNLMAAQNIKVKIFQNGQWSKTWYLGPAAQNHDGQIMLLDDAEQGKSAFPVLMELNNMNGIIDPRFYADPLQWMCQDLITMKLSEVSEINVKFNDEPQRSFKVTKKDSDMKIFQKSKQLTGISSSSIYDYLSNYQDVNFNTANYELNTIQMDSLKRTTPFCELSIKKVGQKKNTYKLYRIVSGPEQRVGMAEMQDIDLDRFWCELPTGEFVKCQYFVFNRLLRGDAYFPLDLTGVKTHDGIQFIESETIVL
jgi:hypothetical protein